MTTIARRETRNQRRRCFFLQVLRVQCIYSSRCIAVRKERPQEKHQTERRLSAVWYDMLYDTTDAVAADGEGSNRHTHDTTTREPKVLTKISWNIPRVPQIPSMSDRTSHQERDQTLSKKKTVILIIVYSDRKNEECDLSTYKLWPPNFVLGHSP